MSTGKPLKYHVSYLVFRQIKHRVNFTITVFIMQTLLYGLFCLFVISTIAFLK